MATEQTEPFRRLEQLFAAAVDRPPAEQRALLAAAAAEDPALAAVAARYLAADRDAGGFLEDAVAAGAAAVAQTLGTDAGRRVGPYRLVRELGRGGMGAVYLAERDDRQFDHRVAVKLLHRGLETAQFVARFRTERQILAQLDHPAIARLFDGGTTDDGRPYLVMELIEGRPIDVHCDAERLSPAARLALVVEVLDAVRAAHQSLVVHRDLKPSNVLVTADGRPKLLDFGVAKILRPERPEGQEVTDITSLTGLRQAQPMTLSWASPEQVQGLPVTTATDVYAAGVLLYRLLTGRHPYPVAGRSAHEVERLILEHRPERPSQAVLRADDPEAARRRGLSPAALARQLKGDLDAIVLGAIAKTPAERYGSVERLADDLRRHLAGRPIAFRPTPFHARLRKAARRHPWGGAAAGLIAVLGLGLIVSLSVLSARRAEERDRATRVASLLVDLFEIAEPGERQGSSITARELLDQGTDRVRHHLAGAPETQGALLTTLGRLYAQLGLYDRAVGVLRQSVTIERRRGRGARRDLAAALGELGRALAQGGRFGEAEPVFREVLGLVDAAYPEGHPEVVRAINNWALVQHDLGRYQAAEPLYRRAVALERREGGAAGTAVARGNWALLLIDLGRHREAAAVCREILALREAAAEPDPAGIADALEYLAMALQGQGRLAEAEAAVRRSLALRERHLPPGDRDLARSRNLLGAVLRDRGALATAEPLLRGALAERRHLLGADHPEVAVSLEDLGDLLLARRDFAAADRAFVEAARILAASTPDSHPTLARLAAGRATARVRATRCAAGTAALERALRQVPPGDSRARRGRQLLAACGSR